MEFFLGCLFTLALVICIRQYFILSKFHQRFAVKNLQYSQSYIYSLISNSINRIMNPEELPRTQSRERLSKNEIRVVFLDNRAYWIKDNCFYHAAVIEGKIDESTKKVVDTIGMDRVELDKMFFIVQKLTEGNKNDGGNPGVKGL